MANLSYWFGPRGNIGFVREVLQQGPTDAAVKSFKGVIPAFAQVDSDGNNAPAGSAADPAYSQTGYLPAGTDRSGTTSATANTSTQLAAANATRRGLNIQNISQNPIGVNEVGGTAAIGTPGTYTLAAGASINIRTNRQINVVSGSASSSYTALEF